MAEEICYLVQTEYTDKLVSGIKLSKGFVGSKKMNPISPPRECFFKSEPSIVFPTISNNFAYVNYLVQTYLAPTGFRGNLGFNLDNSMDTEESNHTEVAVGGSEIGIPPQLLYTQNIATCLGLSLYNLDSRQGSLHHVAGVERSSVNHLKSIVDKEIERLGDELIVKFVSGLATIDPASQQLIYGAREECRNYLKQKLDSKSELVTCFCDEVGMQIHYFSLNLKDGKGIVKKRKYSQELLIQADIESDILTGKL